MCAQFGLFDTLGDGDFFLASQQRDLAHLLEIHPNRIVEDVVLGCAHFFLFSLFLTGLEGFNFGVVEDLNFEILEDGNDVFDFVRIVDAIGQGFVDVLVSKEALLFGKSD